ncbi:hypothetical protein SEMRO_250_G098940.1 [Seminavis robusta]|uniref:Uncharacterized protein n=1 Tax=Seminavis robusta TaxID=568900 RepID=A0A9N8DNR5_9STRA|nr:hypothetical protein SEMRO_250_G098940.1 [Seminavis robusta]|eukprot:Sro250_g098940.1 n/a (1103) ;mRNA; r:18114-21422
MATAAVAAAATTRRTREQESSVENVLVGPARPGIAVTLPITCAWFERETCLAIGLVSCSACDLYRTVQHQTYFLGRPQQSLSRDYRCRIPSKQVQLLPVIIDAPVPPAPAEEYSGVRRSARHSGKKRKAIIIPDSSGDEDDRTEEIVPPRRPRKRSALGDISNGARSAKASRAEAPTAITAATSTVTSPREETNATTAATALLTAPNPLLGNPTGVAAVTATKLTRKQNGVRTSTSVATAGDFPSRLLDNSFKSIPVTNTKPRSTLPSQQSLVNSSVWFRWYTSKGRQLDKDLHKAVMDEIGKDKKNGNSKLRRINLDLFARVIWSVIGFVYPSRWLRSRAKALVEVVFGYFLTTFPDFFHDILLKKSSQLIRKERMQAWKFQRTMDLFATGGLNYEACNSLRSGVEELPKSSQDGVIPHGTTIARTAKQLEQHAEEDFGLSIVETINDHGPTLRFDFEIYLRMILAGFGLDHHAETGSLSEPVLLAHTLDGAQLTAHLGHVTAGVKIIDPRAVDPITGRNLFLDHLYQSRDLCFPCQITFGRDCKDLYTDCFHQFHSLFNGGLVIPSLGDLPELSNFNIVSPQDMSSIWKTTGLGGGSHQTLLFCYACMCHNHQKHLFQTGSNRCPTCQRLKVGKCFCHPVNDQTFLGSTREVLKKYVEDAVDDGYEKLKAVSKRSNLRTNPHQVDKASDKTHIDFVPLTDLDMKGYKNFLRSELKLRLGSNKTALREAMNRSIDDRRALLKSLVAKEDTLWLARQTLTRHDQVNSLTDKLLCEEAIPCILHLEMRVNEKLFWSLLSQALDRYQEADGKVRKEMIKVVTECVKDSILGDENHGRSAQWTFPLRDGGKQVEPRTMTNTQSRKCVRGMKTLATLIFSQQFDEKSRTPTITRANNAALLKQWHDLMDGYQPLMTMARQKEDVTTQDLDSFHLMANRFMTQYVTLFDGQGITNYIHMIGSGHLHYYLMRYGNLYKFSQQGWEAMNQKLKHFYFNNTNHGGCAGNSNGDMIRGDHVRPLMRMCQRSLMWRLGHGDAFFQTQTIAANEDNGEYQLDINNSESQLESQNRSSYLEEVAVEVPKTGSQSHVPLEDLFEDEVAEPGNALL